MDAVETYFTIQLAERYFWLAAVAVLIIGVIISAVADHFKK